ncbi:hypothetical protein Acr_00g0011720 [Actinidia rufa]|uniref:Uncharacterized protein n=1 Tax=Actinidia rufa TaxID=165716 RepID=A0A7J0DAY8_9ERIC|nr:hypothetical protein Acr_00g0011720 [Actinidia rufa]
MEGVAEDIGSKRRRMPNGDSTANVGDLVEMESQGHLILGVTSKMDKIGIGNVRTHGESIPGNPSLMSRSHQIRRHDLGDVLILTRKDFTPHQLPLLDMPRRLRKYTLPSWISEHLGKWSYMTTEVTQCPLSPREDPSDNEGDPSSNEGSPSVDTRPLPERETNMMTQGELDRLRESCFFSSAIQIRLPEADKTIACKHCNVLPTLTEIEQQRFNQTSNTLERGTVLPNQGRPSLEVIRLLHPDHDIQDLQINPELVEADEDEENDELDNNHPP